jgi:spermidine/putrescine transport system substrate-binding protein
MLKMKRLIAFVLVCLFLAACSSANTGDTNAGTTTGDQTPAASGEPGTGKITSKEINVYAWSEYVPQALLDGFQEEYGLKVNYDTYSSNEELMAKLQAGASGYDVIIPSDYMVAIMAKQGMLEELDHDILTNLKNIDPQFMNLPFDPGNKYSIPYQWGTTGLVVNRANVTGEIDSWTDLWDPAYKGRIILPDDQREVIGMALRVLGYDTNSTDPNQLEEAKVKLQELLPNVKLFDSDSPKTAILSGEVWLGQTWNGEGALAHQENNQIDYLCPSEGCTIYFDNLAVPAGAPHLDAALAFINYVMRPDVSILITKEFAYSNPNQAALDLMKTADPDLYNTYMSSPATNPSKEDIDNAAMIEDVGEATTLYDDVWTEVKGGQ